jgi:hypothetical protein
MQEETMRSLLPRFLFAPAIVAAAALATGTALADSSVNIPFNFTVAGKMWPAGRYDVLAGPVANSVRLSSIDSSHNYVWIAGPGDPNPMDQRTVLTFDTMNDGHALRTVQYGNRITSRLDKPRKEYVPTRIMAGD